MGGCRGSPNVVEILLSETSKRNDIWLSGTLKVKFGCWGPPKHSEISILKKNKNWIFWEFFKSTNIFFSHTNPNASWTYGQNYDKLYKTDTTRPTVHQSVDQSNAVQSSAVQYIVVKCRII